MTWAGLYFSLALLSGYCTLTAIVQARKLYWLVPVYFFSAWLCGELALMHLLWQVALSAVLAFFGGLADPLAQTGLGVFALSWLGLVYLHCQAMDTPLALRPALAVREHGPLLVGVEVRRQDHPAVRRGPWRSPPACSRSAPAPGRRDGRRPGSVGRCGLRRPKRARSNS